MYAERYTSISIGDENIRTCSISWIHEAHVMRKTFHGLIWNNNFNRDIKWTLSLRMVQNIVLNRNEMWPLYNRMEKQDYNGGIRPHHKMPSADKRERNNLWWERGWRLWWRENGEESIKALENMALGWNAKCTAHSWTRPSRKKRWGTPPFPWDKCITQVIEDRGLKERGWFNRNLWERKMANSQRGSHRSIWFCKLVTSVSSFLHILRK